MRKHTIDDFWKSINKNGPNGCWEWTGYKSRSGHGRFGIDGKSQSVHRFSWELIYGPIPNGQVICHQCDNPGCVNPTHLFIGTQKDNIIDRDKKHRGKNKLNQNDIDYIRTNGKIGSRRGYNNGSNVKELSNKFNVSIQTIHKILKNESYKFY